MSKSLRNCNQHLMQRFPHIRHSGAMETPYRSRTHDDQRLIGTRRKLHTFFYACIRESFPQLDFLWSIFNFLGGRGAPSLVTIAVSSGRLVTAQRSQAAETRDKQGKKSQNEKCHLSQTLLVSINTVDLSEEFTFQNRPFYANVTSTKVNLMHLLFTGKVNNDWKCQIR